MNIQPFYVLRLRTTPGVSCTIAHACFTNCLKTRKPGSPLHSGNSKTLPPADPGKNGERTDNVFRDLGMNKVH